MDYPGCNVCHLPLDEEKHQPRHLGCSHDACTACIKSLIINGSFVCPFCRKVIKANKAEDLPINHGVVQILRLLKGFKISDYKQDEEHATTNTKEFCGIHKFIVDKRCITCKVWICVQCKEYHIPDTGCEIQEYNEALNNLKKEQKEQVEPTLLSIREDLRLLSSKLSEIDTEKNKLEEEIKKLNNFRKNVEKAVEEGTEVLNEVETVAAKIDAANTSKELNESTHLASEWHQFAQVWRKKNAKCVLEKDSLLEIIKSEPGIYAAMGIKGNSRHSLLHFKGGNIYQHCFGFYEFNSIKSSKIFPYQQIKTWLPEAQDLVFLDLAICGEHKGRVTIRLRQDLPSYAKNIPLLFTGENRHSLMGLKCVNHNKNNLGINGHSISAMTKNFKMDSNAGCMAEQGSILAHWRGQYIDFLYIYIEEIRISYSDLSGYERFGKVETGLDTITVCRNHGKQNEVTVVECGVVIKEDLLRKNSVTL